MRESLISEPIRPIFAAPSADAEESEFQAAGEPLLPGRFEWRQEELVVAEVLERWKEYSSPGPSMPERYLRKHWFRIRTAAGQEMKIYFERQARSKSRQRWWLFSAVTPE